MGGEDGAWSFAVGKRRTATPARGRPRTFRLASREPAAEFCVIRRHGPGWRICEAQVGRLVSFGRRLAKVRLHAAGQLPADDQVHLGDERTPVPAGLCGRFLGVRGAGLRERVLAGGTARRRSTVGVVEWVGARRGQMGARPRAGIAARPAGLRTASGRPATNRPASGGGPARDFSARVSRRWCRNRFPARGARRPPWRRG